MRKLIATALVAGIFALTGVQPSQASKRPGEAPVINIEISISDQSMSVDLHGFPYANWKVSTARDGFYTPLGRYRVQRLAKMHYSQKYDNAPMPFSVFFKGGYAIHGTDYVRSLGRPASHGCVRLHPRNAARLFSLVQKYGMNRTRITLVE
jgi:lipoprotein-anchoring transpeptidase ErfK/SrfK